MILFHLSFKRMGTHSKKIENRVRTEMENSIPGLFQDFFNFSRTQFLPNFCIKQREKCIFFFSRKHRSGNRKKGALVFFVSDSGIKTKTTHKLNGIEYKSHLPLQRVSSDFHSVFCDFHTFFCASHKSEKTHCILYFQGLIHIFKDNFTKFQDNSRSKGIFFNFQEFSRTKVKFKDFSRSVRTLEKLFTPKGNF